jgi:hypothetical protein
MSNSFSCSRKLFPAVAQEDCFALKAGTAINLFYRDMPRLSVDIERKLGRDRRGARGYPLTEERR